MSSNIIIIVIYIHIYLLVKVCGQGAYNIRLVKLVLILKWEKF